MATYLSFRAQSSGARSLAVGVSIVLSFGAALCVLAAVGAEDYNDYPGYTCSMRDGYVPEGFPTDLLLPTDSDRVTAFHPLIDWTHEYELFPVGMQCAYWVHDDARVQVTTHSPWPYTVFFYGLIAVAPFQVVRVIRGIVRKRD
ncbi:hypothetical protein [Rhodococcus sp. NPDC058521]|uniref:hypothetical protein n=1 Tax=Rhodococcus sp. NPDC058521 TaxID=3346536 RepID=UPI00365A13CD